MPRSRIGLPVSALRTAGALVLGLAWASPGLAVTLGYELSINDPVFNSANGNLNVPDFQLSNTSVADVDITEFQLTIGDTAFNYDFVRLQSAFIDPGNDLSFSLNTVGQTNDGIGDDILIYSFLGFNPGDVFRFEVDVDPDAGGPFTDFRGALFPTATALVTFSDGSVLSNTLNPTGPDDGTFVFAESAIAPVPLPGGASLMGLAGLLSFLVLRRRPAKAVAA